MLKSKLFSLSWSDTRFIDLWAIVHFISGMFYGPFFSLLGISYWPGMIIVGATAVLYEYGEYRWGVLENVENIGLDIILAMAGYAFYVRLFSGKPRAFQWKAIIIISIVNLTLAYFGWLAFLERTG